eukprot:365886-Chlamydomonas_euryale.AAC.1
MLSPHKRCLRLFPPSLCRAAPIAKRLDSGCAAAAVALADSRALGCGCRPWLRRDYPMRPARRSVRRPPPRMTLLLVLLAVAVAAAALPLSAASTQHASSGARHNVRGVQPDLAHRYAPGDDGRGFGCLDGSGVVDFARVNDNYCDCADGSDEPGVCMCVREGGGTKDAERQVAGSGAGW